MCQHSIAASHEIRRLLFPTMPHPSSPRRRNPQHRKSRGAGEPLERAVQARRLNDNVAARRSEANGASARIPTCLPIRREASFPFTVAVLLDFDELSRVAGRVQRPPPHVSTFEAPAAVVLLSANAATLWGDRQINATGGRPIRNDTCH